MKINRLLYLIPLFVLLACGDEDTEGPSIRMDLPESVDNESEFDLNFEITDASLISRYTLKIEDDSEELFSIISTPNTTTVNRSESVFISTTSNSIVLSLVAEDENGNITETERSIEINAEIGGSLVLNFKLLYEGEPLVMFEPLTYTTGERISFTRVSTYLSDITLDNTLVKDVDFIRIDEGHLDASDAAIGFSYILPGVPAGTYEKLSFRYGIRPEDNARRPADYPSGHPLAASGEYWVSWNSYIFVKFEGRIDTDGDGQEDQGFALHLGSDEAARIIESTANYTVTNGAMAPVEISIDLTNILGGNNSPYDLIENGQIHSLDQLPLIRLLADNLKTNTKF